MRADRGRQVFYRFNEVCSLEAREQHRNKLSHPDCLSKQKLLEVLVGGGIGGSFINRGWRLCQRPHVGVNTILHSDTAYDFVLNLIFIKKCPQIKSCFVSRLLDLVRHMLHDLASSRG
jgi:hypothetical protein